MQSSVPTKMNYFETILKGKDLRSIGQSNVVVAVVDNQNQFDELFHLFNHPDRKIVMRAADAIENNSMKQDYLQPHKNDLLDLLYKAQVKELKWHLALLVARLELSDNEFSKVWQFLKKWANDKKESKIVRVNSLQGLYILSERNKEFKQDLFLTASMIQNENIPSINARIKKLRLEWH